MTSPSLDVVVLNWPAQADEAAELARAGVPRLLLVAPDADPPTSPDPDEEWVRLPADERDVAARMLRLTRRAVSASASAETQIPRVDEAGRLLYQGRWVALSPTEARLAAALSEQFGAVVSEAELGRRAWPDGRWRANSLRVHLTRLRHRLAPLGLEVRRIRSQGLILQPVAG